MDIKSKYLTLSMREQICFIIIFLTIFSVIVVLCIIGSLIYEVLKEDYKIKKTYFFTKYREYIETCFYFENFCLLQYEEVIKRIQKQIWEFHKTVNYYRNTSNFNNNITNNIYSLNKDILNNNISEKYLDDKLYYLCYFPSNGIIENIDIHISLYLLNLSSNYYCSLVDASFLSFYETFSSFLFTHNIYSAFRIPGFDIPIINTPLFVSIDRFLMLSYNSSRIYENLNNIFGDISKYNDNKIDNYYNKLVNNSLEKINKQFLNILNEQLLPFDYMFSHVLKEMMTSEEYQSFNISDSNTYDEYIKKTSGYYSSINYGNSKFSVLTYDNNDFFYCETTIIDNFLYFIINRLSMFLNITFIPLYSENNTIISPELCISFLIRQLNYQIDENKFNELLNKIIKGKSTIEDCFANKDIFENQLEINDVLIFENFSDFYSVYNNINQGLFNSEIFPYYYIKYTYPNYNFLIDFNSDYLLLDQVNYYLFAPFKEPIEFIDALFLMYKNCFFLIIIIILYTWTILMIINLLIFTKIIKQLTDPIKKLQEAIESSSIKDENIFKYEYDDFINELFITSKELLTGQIDKNSNDKGLDLFNILSIPKDKQKNIDKNIYQRNLIINNDIMNELIEEQQNMFDFSENIDINEELDAGKDLNGLDDSSYISDIKEDETKSNNKNYIKKNDNLNKIKENKIREEIEDKEPYKKLFKIAEYFSYYQNKKENNYITIINNEIKDESKKSTITKINNTLSMNSKMKKSITKSDILGKSEENISINMLNNENISYLWYMIEKKKKNKSINYYIGRNYEELFMDDNNYQKNYQDFFVNKKLSKDRKRKKLKKKE